jgi:hypothetical protein
MSIIACFQDSGISSSLSAVTFICVLQSCAALPKPLHHLQKRTGAEVTDASRRSFQPLAFPRRTFPAMGSYVCFSIRPMRPSRAIA